MSLSELFTQELPNIVVPPAKYTPRKNRMFTARQVRAFRSQHKRGISGMDLAEAAHVHFTTMYGILKGRLYADVR